MGKYFGTDGIRGVAGEALTIDMALKIGYGLRATFNTKKIVIGRDTRESSQALSMALATGALNAGVDVEDAGVVPTPVIAYHTKEEAMIGVMVTASHNPYHDNGIKVFNKGFKMTPEEEASLETFIDGALPVKSTAFGSFTINETIKTRYLNLYQGIDSEIANLSVVFDAAHGATSYLVHDVFLNRVDTAQVIHDQPDGRNINVDCGSTHLKRLIDTVKSEKADVGFAFDGDGDRVLAVDHHGDVFDGDMLIYVVATHLKAQGKLSKNTVVLTKMSNPGIIKAYQEANIKVVQTDVGDKYVTREMMKHGFALGGENSGHIIMKDLLQTGDGMLVAAMILSIMQARKQTLAKLCEAIDIYPQVVHNVKHVDKTVLEHKAVKDVIQAVRTSLGKDAQLLVRPSGTEPVIRITVSVKDRDQIKQAIDTIEASFYEHGGAMR